MTRAGLPFPFDAQHVDEQLAAWAVRDRDCGRRNLVGLGGRIGPDVLGRLKPVLDVCFPTLADADMALNNLERLAAVDAGRDWLIGSGGERIEELLRVVSASQFFADLLVSDPGMLEVVGGSIAPHPTPADLVRRLEEEVQAAADDAQILRRFRRFRQREQVRVGVSDIVHERSLEEVTRGLSQAAEAAVEVALRTALLQMAARFGTPRRGSGGPSGCVILAFGKLGGEELNYSSDIDLMMVYDEEGRTTGRRGISNAEYYSRVMAEVVRLLAAHTDAGQAYRVDLRLRPEGKRGPTARSLTSTLSYYDARGRTWERQALIKIRPVAGDRNLGDEFLRSIEGFVWRKYLSFSEINEIKAMKRRIESRTHRVGDSERDVKTGRGGIRDVEFTIQFLQLLNGGDWPEVRQRGTLAAMVALESAGCLTDPEFRALDEAYRLLRKTEHRLQILFDWQTHRLPEQPAELGKLAMRLGYPDAARRAAELNAANTRSETRTGKSDFGPQRHSPLDEPPTTLQLQTRDLLFDPLEQFLHDYQEKTRVTRTVLDHLLHQTFVGDEAQAEPESDLILDPDPDETAIQHALGRYPFRDVPGAFRNLTQLAQESVPFLSARRCRHFLASIAPRLLRAVAETPDPDSTLTNLERVSASLGAKAVLWELFSFLPASLRLYVDLCANSPFLSETLVNNPGMIDDLLDSLILNQPRSLEDLLAELRELCRRVEKADAIEPILRSFQDKELLRIGVRDLLGKDDIRATAAALSDLAEALLVEAASRCEAEAIRRHGRPTRTDGSPCRYALIAMGKLGGREMSYHSDLDLVMVYEDEGTTAAHGGQLRVENFQYFTELAQQIIRFLSQTGPLGRLYAVDMRLRPTGKSGSLVVPLAEFRRYYERGAAQLWERQSLTRARGIHGDAAFITEVMEAAKRAITGKSWSSVQAAEIAGMRSRLEATASPRSLKRAAGGIIDVEFIVQMIQLEHGGGRPELLQTNVWDALDAAAAAGLLSTAEHRTLFTGYSFLRLAEARLRIVTNRPLNEVPQSNEEVEKLARRMGFDSNGEGAASRFRREWSTHASAIRKLFELRTCQATSR